jgi:hypothetical protein
VKNKNFLNLIEMMGLRLRNGIVQLRLNHAGGEMKERPESFSWLCGITLHFISTFYNFAFIRKAEACRSSFTLWQIWMWIRQAGAAWLGLALLRIAGEAVDSTL